MTRFPQVEAAEEPAEQDSDEPEDDGPVKRAAVGLGLAMEGGGLEVYLGAPGGFLDGDLSARAENANDKLKKAFCNRKAERAKSTVDVGNNVTKTTSLKMVQGKFRLR